MKFLLYIFLFSLNFSCNGQDKSPAKEFQSEEKIALERFENQEQQVEFNSFNMLYNGKVIKLENIRKFTDVFGKYDYRDGGDLIYFHNAINPSAYVKYKLDKNGYSIIEYEGQEYSIMDGKGEYIEEIWNLYKNKKGIEVVVRDINGTIIGNIHTYRIWMSPYETASIVPDEAAIAKAKIPALNGYIKINGKLIHQSITKKELAEKLRPMPEGGEIVGMLGDPVLIYDLGKNAKDFDPNMDPNDTRVFIDIVFKIDPITSEEKGIYYINYYYSLKDEDNILTPSF